MPPYRNTWSPFGRPRARSGPEGLADHTACDVVIVLFLLSLAVVLDGDRARDIAFVPCLDADRARPWFGMSAASIRARRTAVREVPVRPAPSPPRTGRGARWPWRGGWCGHRGRPARAPAFRGQRAGCRRRSARHRAPPPPATASPAPAGGRATCRCLRSDARRRSGRAAAIAWSRGIASSASSSALALSFSARSAASRDLSLRRPSRVVSSIALALGEDRCSDGPGREGSAHNRGCRPGSRRSLRPAGYD